ncbi:spore germination protein [Cohnella suwonensis]|uniref:Spore germination protein n=1 Tax=Cohnella suwonensis TaxID=696072 RepID=A0ABW0LSJ0_9BACL
MRRKRTMPEQLEKKLEELKSTNESELFDSLDDNEAALRKTFTSCSDLMVRKFHVFDSIPCMLVFLEVLVDINRLNDGFLIPLMAQETVQFDSPAQIIERLQSKLVPIVKANIIDKMNDAAQHIVKGETLLFVQSCKQAITLNIPDPMHRELQEPNMEAVIRGPRLGFIEKLDINMALIRHRIRTPQLKMEKMSIGSVSQTDIAIAYIENRAPQTVIDEIKKRLAAIEMDSILESGYIEELISEHPYSPFPVIQSTQRPDSVSASLIEGKVAILSDGTPMVLIAPITLWYGFQTVEDYYMNFIFATMLRWLRYLFAFLALCLPSIYVAITTFHNEMLPTSLALSLAAAREVVPFPAMLETLIMEVTFEALREAGVRLPRPVGQTISIVGALVIGQAAVQAGIISAPIVIIVSLTGIASFLIPHPGMSQAVSILRFPMILLAGTFGLYGLSAVLLAILIHLVNLRSFGVLYLSPLAPVNFSGLKDVLVRVPWSSMKKRQQYLQQKRELENK